MPCGLVRTDLNLTGVSFRNGSPVTLPKDFGNPVTWLPIPSHFGNPIPPLDPSFNSNVVSWVVNPAHFGNIIGGVLVTSGLLLEDGVTFFELEDGTGILLLE